MGRNSATGPHHRRWRRVDELLPSGAPVSPFKDGAGRAGRLQRRPAYCVPNLGVNLQPIWRTAALREQLTTSRWQPLVCALMTLRGVEFVAAVTLVAEIGDRTRFAQPTQLMSYLGLVPNKCSIGESRVLGKITRTGNGHDRCSPIEVALAYCLPARMGRELVVRNDGQPQLWRDIAWRAQVRPCSRFHCLQTRGMLATRPVPRSPVSSRTSSGIPAERSRPPTDRLRLTPSRPRTHSAITHSRPINNATREHDEGNPRSFCVGIHAMTPVTRSGGPATDRFYAATNPQISERSIVAKSSRVASVSTPLLDDHAVEALS